MNMKKQFHNFILIPAANVFLGIIQEPVSHNEIQCRNIHTQTTRIIYVLLPIEKGVPLYDKHSDFSATVAQ